MHFVLNGLIILRLHEQKCSFIYAIVPITPKMSCSYRRSINHLSKIVSLIRVFIALKTMTKFTCGALGDGKMYSSEILIWGYIAHTCRVQRLRESVRKSDSERNQ